MKPGAGAARAARARAGAHSGRVCPLEILHFMTKKMVKIWKYIVVREGGEGGRQRWGGGGGGGAMGLLGAALGAVAARPWLGLAGGALLCGTFGLSAGLYLLHLAALRLCAPHDLRKRYGGARWALVTGASSGIGKSLTVRLAEQGLDVVMVAYPDKVLDKSHAELQKRFPKRKFVKVPADLGSGGYLETVAKATEGMDVQCVFSNAGYMLSGFFHKTELPRILANLECNVTSGVAICHFFAQRMIAKGLPGCIVLTSSAAAAMPAPLSIMYSATKSFVSSFGAGLAAEVTSKGIDVCVVHPSPVASNFYDKQKKIDMLDFFKGFAVSPDALPDEIFRCIGRTTWADVGLTAQGFRMMMKIVDYNFMSTLLAKIGHTFPDYQRHDN